MPREKWWHQPVAIDALRENIRSGVRRQVLQLPTGGGKTRVAAALTDLVKARGKRVVFLADRIELVDQASERFASEGIQHGIIQGKPDFRFRPELPVQIATIQTLSNREHDPFDLVLVDECHSGGKRLNDWILRQNSVVVGLSATPWTKGLGKVYQELVRVVSVSELIEDGVLVDVVAWAPAEEPDLRGVKVVAGEWADKELAEAVDQPKLVGDIVAHWIQRGENRRTIGFAVDVAHSKHMAEAFNAAGVPAAHVDGYEDPAARRETLERFRRGEYRVVFNVGILDKGYDDPEVSALILARPVRSSLILHIQMLGRLLRAFPGKEYGLILDHAGNLARHGFPTDAQPDKLDDGKPKPKAVVEREEKKPKKCPKCYHVKPAGVHVCPKCGFAPAPPNEVFHEPGELKQVMKTADKRQLYAEILGLQQQNGRSDGWVAHTFRKFTGAWPNRYKDTAPAPPTDWTRSRVKSFDIAFAKSKNKPKRNPLSGWKAEALGA